MRFFLAIVTSFLGVIAAMIFMFFLFVAVFGAILAAQDPAPRVERNSVLVLDLSGAMPETHPEDPLQELFAGRAVTLRQTIRALEKAAVDDRIVGVWLRPTNVTASWAALAELRAAIEAFRASGKPLIASSNADGFLEQAYFLASAADSIYSAPESFFLMNGFHIAAPFFGEMFARLDIEPIVIRAGDYKAAAENLTERQFSPENREQFSELLRAVDERFRATVADARPIERGVIDRIIADGGIYLARDAAAIGLIDELRYDHEIENLWRHHTQQRPDERLRTVSLTTYVGVPDHAAGLRPGDRRNRIAVLYATGVITPGRSSGDGMGGTTLGAETFVENLSVALRDERTRAIVVRIDSPGGSATASDAMWAAMHEAAQRLPVVVSMAGVAASGGYYIAAPADVIVAEEATITGSIGVISLLFDATAFLDDRLGVSIDTIQTGPGAGLLAGLGPVTEIQIEIMQQITERIYETFIERVAAGRRLDPETVRALAAGRVYNGRRAMELGLVDEVGDLRRAIQIAAERADLAEGEYQLTILPRRRPLVERLSETFRVENALAWWAQRNATPHERLVRQQGAMLRSAAEMHGQPQMRMLNVPEIR